MSKQKKNFTAKPNQDTQDAIIRQLYIPPLLRDKLTKPEKKTKEE